MAFSFTKPREATRGGRKFTLCHVNPSTGVPGGLLGGRCAYQDQFRKFKFHRLHTRENFFLRK